MSSGVPHHSSQMKARRYLPGFAQLRAEELRGGLMAATAPHREWRAALSSALCDSNRPEGTAWSCIRGGLRERLCPGGWWAWNRLPRAVGTAPDLEVKGCLDTTLRYRVCILAGAWSWIQ